MNKIILNDDHREILYGMAINQSKQMYKVSIRYSGEQIFKYEIMSGILSKAIYNETTLTYEAGHIYIRALNRTSAEKKLYKILYTVDYRLKEAKAELDSTISFMGSSDNIIDKPK